MAKKIRWGIIGCGNIAKKFSDDLQLSKSGVLFGAASRSKQKARRFANECNALKAYGSYEELVGDADVDVVYVATPHPFHVDNALLAINAGKHVLCEKPITVNAKQLRRLISAAKRNGVFLMDGMWSRFFPATVRLRKWLAEGRIGEVLGVEADFGVKFSAGPEHRIYNPELGGGALLDLGIYCVSFASMVYGGQPDRIGSVVNFCKTGVDDQSVLAFGYEGGATASLSISSKAVFKQEGRIFGSSGKITVHENFYRPTSLTLEVDGKKAKTISLECEGHGFHYEADHVAKCLRKKQLESDEMGLDESLEIMKTLDRIRKQWKLKYPGE